MAIPFGDEDWARLVRRIHSGRCTPFFGAGVNDGVLPKGSDLAEEWATRHHYPLPDSYDLAKVSQFRAVGGDLSEPKEELAERFKNSPPPDFENPNEPHTVLARLPFSLYLTTNYDANMARALQRWSRPARQEICCWNRLMQMRRDAVTHLDKGFVPDIAKPLVYHLHGHVDYPDSFVLTEDDYIDFLVSVNRDGNLLPLGVREALAGSSLLFIGYRLSDLNFRVLFRMIVGLDSGMPRINVSVQLLPEPRAGLPPERVQDYLDAYFAKNMNVRVFWGTARQFSEKLREQWNATYGGI
jgi:hypothetical protein